MLRVYPVSQENLRKTLYLSTLFVLLYADDTRLKIKMISSIYLNVISMIYQLTVNLVYYLIKTSSRFSCITVKCGGLNIKHIKKLHLNFVITPKILNTKFIGLVYGELGRFPLIINVKVRMIFFWDVFVLIRSEL